LIGTGRHFATTRWSLVLRAGAGASDVGADEALASLCEAYWYPLYAYLRIQGRSADDAQDLTQGFFARMLESGRFATLIRRAAGSAPSCSRHSRTLPPTSAIASSPRSAAAAHRRSRWSSKPPRAASNSNRRSDETLTSSIRRWATTLLDRFRSRGCALDTVRSPRRFELHEIVCGRRRLRGELAIALVGVKF